jgi:hypothetical protein
MFFCKVFYNTAWNQTFIKLAYNQLDPKSNLFCITLDEMGFKIAVLTVLACHLVVNWNCASLRDCYTL